MGFVAFNISNRWSVFVVDETGLKLELRWLNSEGLWCNAMGFAPLFSMPVTRRAAIPFISIWPCGHDNKFKKHKGKIIGVGDCNHNLSEKQYSTMKTSTEERNLELRDVFNLPKVELMRKTTFCFSRSSLLDPLKNMLDGD